MKILFTGASSFTGMWFVKELAASGHQVTATFSKSLDDYEGLRRERVERALEWCDPVYNCPFGGEAFFKTISTAPEWDLLCHHAADVNNYKSPDFDYTTALANNTKNLKFVLQNLKEKGCRKILLTGSVFEQGEGKGTDMLRAVSPYGLSKGLTAEVFKFYCEVLQLKLGKFVIPNPFGPFEEPRFTTFLIKSWFEGTTPSVTAPEYGRDNIPVSLLAKAYRDFAEKLSPEAGYQQTNPSCYAGNQGEFTQLFAREMEKRLSVPCKVEILKQQEFPEPHIRINSDPVDGSKLGWDEKKFWDELADFYKVKYGKQQPK